MASLMNFEPRPNATLGTPRRLSAPRERTLTELGLRDLRFEPNEDRPHHLLSEYECARLRCYSHDKTFEMDCGE